jgi:hypothetical protein
MATSNICEVVKIRAIIYGLAFGLVIGAYILFMLWHGGSGPRRISYMDRVEAVIFTLSTAASSACLTSVACRRAQVHGRQPGWHLVLFGTAVTMLLTMVYYGRLGLFEARHWVDLHGRFWRHVMNPSFAAAVIALAASLVVVYYFRARFRNEKAVA